MAKSKPNKIIVTHPVTGTERKFDATIYEPFKSAIISSLKGSRGKTFTELTDDVIKIIHKRMLALNDPFPGTPFRSGWISKRGG